MVARDPAVAARIAALRQYGWTRHYISDEIGINSRLDELQAAVLRVKLAYLDAANARRRDIARAYDAILGARAPRRRRGSEHVYHLYVVRTPDRDQMQATLRERGVGSGIHYPVPVHLQPAYANQTGGTWAVRLHHQRAGRGRGAVAAAVSGIDGWPGDTGLPMRSGIWRTDGVPSPSDFAGNAIAEKRVSKCKAFEVTAHFHHSLTRLLASWPACFTVFGSAHT